VEERVDVGVARVVMAATVVIKQAWVEKGQREVDEEAKKGDVGKVAMRKVTTAVVTPVKVEVAKRQREVGAEVAVATEGGVEEGGAEEHKR
jgi:hypothetical protein